MKRRSFGFVRIVIEKRGRNDVSKIFTTSISLNDKALTSSGVVRMVFGFSTITTRLGRRHVERLDVTVNDVVKVFIES